MQTSKLFNGSLKDIVETFRFLDRSATGALAFRLKIDLPADRLCLWLCLRRRPSGRRLTQIPHYCLENHSSYPLVRDLATCSTIIFT